MPDYFWDNLENYSDNLAVVSSDGQGHSYADLDKAAKVFAEEHFAGLEYRPLVLLETANSFPVIAAYIAVLQARYPVILLAPGAIAEDSRIADTYQPNIVIRSNGDAVTVTRTDAPPVDMHPELAVLLSTSGTTGAPKLVRLSRDNIQSNAESIAQYLELDETERAITTLSFHYSYGMSVVHTHLSIGAALVTTDSSVIEDAFWACADRHGVTSLALVPFQFELLERSGFENRRLPSLRYITQAGGKLAEPFVRRFAELGKRDGWRLFIMYGQTEASPRMAYLPPEDLDEWAFSIGRAVPGGKFHLLADDGSPIDVPNKTGELIYEGPNVMLGYAEERGDLAAPSGPSELHTGDMAEMLENGYFRIVGRLKRFIKIFGLRVSLDEAEDFLRREGFTAWCAGKDERLVVFLTEMDRADRAKEMLVERYHLTESVVFVTQIDAPPLLSSGKVDYSTLTAHANALEAAQGHGQGARVEDTGGVAASLKRAMRVAKIDADRSFLEHGSDSLGYVEVQMVLTELLGSPPPNWEEMPMGELIALCKSGPDRGSRALQTRLQWTPTSLMLRLVAITAVILLHSTSLPVSGGGYLLIMLVGASLGRFQFEQLKAGKVGQVIGTQLTDIVIWYFFLIIGVSFLFNPVNLSWFLLLGNFDPAVKPDGISPYWFVCFYAQAILIVCAFFLVPGLRQTIAGRPFLSGLVGVGAFSALAILIDPSSTATGGIQIRHPLFAMQLVLLGWTIQFSKTLLEKQIISVVLIANALLIWFYGTTVLPFIILGGLLMIWLPTVELPQMLSRLVFFLGANTMYFYLLHPVMLYLVEKNFRLKELDLFLFTIAFTLPVSIGCRIIAQRFLSVSKQLLFSRRGAAN
ncbi:hypothetical protein EOI86_23675 [Hwanghaeella grinnelliae]|uniref:AMP-dependent synthetase/ligase domain-containing protein n=1 Tax=Hwanghaeella grinnelliae TaxID=2500179 RepID=A0A437QI73_9PROT|nr:AMP-binding protein [Hwanghaeella grinnelliae]RVU34116.1 hypothetical protein EOI86_23675 [Hwanghaeella grinnelliae]